MNAGFFSFRKRLRIRQPRFGHMGSPDPFLSPPEVTLIELVHTP